MLELRDLTLQNKDKVIFQKINLTVNEREIFGILGPNGAGKSSLAYTLMGCEGYKVTSGQIILDGEDITDWPVWRRAKKGLTLAWQEPARFEGISVPEYISLGMKEKSQSGITEALEGVLLDAQVYRRRKVDKTLSGGERKRIELASIFAMRPRLAILDEPDSGIDMLALERIMDFVRGMKEQGISVILITHYADIAKIATRAALIDDGYLVKVGPTAEVVDYYENRCSCCPHFR
ncbi:ABC transporter ATP-binding protein [bacterium]|nr:ABC transporter ATP-binding protein [bacterium]